MGLGLLLIVIVIVIVVIIAGGDKPIRRWLSNNLDGGQDARSILDTRLARGELTREEYDTLRERIEQ